VLVDRQRFRRVEPDDYAPAYLKNPLVWRQNDDRVAHLESVSVPFPAFRAVLPRLRPGRPWTEQAAPESQETVHGVLLI
jgi:hypothetical protein